MLLPIIAMAERALLNERVKTINNTIEMLECQCHTCKTEFSKVVDQETMAECTKLMFKVKEDRHYNTLERQKAKLDRLIRKEEEVINKGGCSKSIDMQRYMHQRGTDTFKNNSYYNNWHTNKRPRKFKDQHHLLQQW